MRISLLSRFAWQMLWGSVFLLVFRGAAYAAPSPFGVAVADTPRGTGWMGPFAGILGWIAVRQSEFYRGLTEALEGVSSDRSALILLLGLSFAYGVFHAAGPGHGKAVISSYLFATGETLRRGIVLSFASAMVQASVAVVLVAVAAGVLQVTAMTMTAASVWLELGSYAMIAAIGGWLLWRKTFGRAHDRHSHHDHHHHDDHVHGHDHDHGHSHAPPPELLAQPLNSRRAIAAILAVGIRPCSGAIIVLVFSLAQGLFLAGIASAYVMGIGTGLTVAILAALTVGARGLALRFAGVEEGGLAKVIKGLEILAALAVLLLGLLLLGGGLANDLSG